MWRRRTDAGEHVLWLGVRPAPTQKSKLTLQVRTRGGAAEGTLVRTRPRLKIFHVVALTKIGAALVSIALSFLSLLSPADIHFVIQ